MNQLDLLWELQRVELELEVQLSTLEQLKTTKKLKKLSDDFKTVREQYYKDNENLDSLNKLNIRYNGDLKYLQSQLETQNSKLYEGEVNDMKGYSKASSDIENTQKQITEVEDKILKSIESTEQLQGVIEGQKVTLSKIKYTHGHIKEKIQLKTKETEQKIEELTTEKENILKDIEPKLLERYTKIKERKQTSVAGVYKGVCMGCNVEVSRGNVQQIKLATAFITCDNCGRILYAKV
jgi:uncharacterized protein